ncbi:MAG: aromatic amino acid transport family protein [Candidatus Pacebacteria bacterium]|nr:aromatic amino acid transport family protein [Candidatus Paceibacterota bacterium]
MNKTLLAVASLVGTIVGAGVFAIPYVFSQSGLIACLVYFLVVGALVVFLHLFFGEAVLRTKKEVRLVGLADKYIGRTGKIVVGVALMIGTVGSLVVYIILLGNFLSLIFPSIFSAFQFSLLAWAFLTALVFFGMRSIAIAEVIMGVVLFLTVGIIIAFCLPKIQTSNLFLFNSKALFLPFGIFLFSLVGWSAVPEIEDILIKKKNLKKAIIIAVLACVIFYVIFGLVIFGTTGATTTQEPFEGLSLMLGRDIMLLAGIFGFLAVATSFVVVANYIKNTLIFDVKTPKIPAFLLACFLPLALFLAGFRSFIGLVSALGAFIGLVEGSSIIFIWLKAKKMGDRKPEYSINLPRIAVFLMAGLLVFGCVVQFVYK